MMRVGSKIITVLWFVVFASAALADDVSVRASTSEEFGRMVFNWPSPVGHDLERDGNRLTLRFSRPLTSSFQRARGALREYISRIEHTNPEPVVVLDLSGDFDAYSFDSGSSIIVEFAKRLEPEEPATQPLQPAQTVTERISTSETKVQAQAGQAPQDLPTIRVRTGEHAAYTRLVFDWTSEVEYSFEQSGGQVLLNFKRPANLNLAAIQQSPPRFVGQVRSNVTEAGVQVAIAIPATASARHFLSGPKVVVDVREPSGDDRIATLPEDIFGTASQTVSVGDAAASLTPPPDAPPPPPAPDAEPEQAGSEPQTDEVPSTPPSQTASGVAPSAAPEETEGSSQQPQQAGQPTPLIAVSREASRQASREAGGEAVDARVSGGAGADGQGVTLRFDWDEPVAAAVFRRVGYLWIAFDKATNVNIAALEQAGAGRIGAVQQVPATSGTVLRMITPRDIHPSLARDGLSWILNFREQAFEARTPIEVNSQPDSPVGARVFLPIPEPGSPIGVTDPDVGDNLVIVPTIPLSHGVVESYTFPEMRILSTMQGVVVVPITDNLRVRPLRQGIELASATPLSLSSVSPEVAAGSKLGALGPVSRVLDLEKWKLAEPEDFMERKQELQSDIARATNSEEELDGRMELARFYFAHAFAAEALGLLRTISETAPEIEDDAEFRLLRGGSNYLLNRLTEAAEDFGHASLDVVDEGAFWRAAVIAKSGEVLAAAHELRRTGAITQPYPKPLKIEMDTLTADAIVSIGDIQQAQQYIEALRAIQPNVKQLAEIDFIEGKLLEVGGDEEGAILKWEEVLEVDNRPTRFKATLAYIDKLMAMDRMDPEEAIEELEGLRFVWRGGEEEFTLLRKLGDLYLDQGIYRNGLLALRQAATYFRDNENAPAVTQQMSDTFNFLYLENGADSLPPVTAIALYDEFKELTPAGRQGDEMIRNLADRLVKVDLLDSAANLLQQQVEFRLEGVEKAEVGLNLAVIHALAGQPEKVMETLSNTEVPNIPEDLAVRRRHLQAESMIRMDRREDALALLKPDKSLNADKIRSELFWKQSDWTNAALSLQKVVRLSNIRPGNTLTEEEASKVLNLATAYTLSGNERALARLRADHSTAMAQTSLKDAFELVAQPLALGMIDPASIPERVKIVTNFRTFLDEYKARLKNERLSNLAREGAIPKDQVPGA